MRRRELDPIFRQARRADLPAIVALLADDGLGRGRDDPALPLDPAYDRAFEGLAADPNQLQLVVELEGEVAGIMQLTFIPGLSRKGALRCQIEAVRVAAAQRGGGLGRRMFDWAIAESRARGCALVQLTSDRTRDDAHRFYERLGFVASHVGYKLSLES
ncbi:MAG: GNAT family N-acetyltransferase [Rhodospirillales bacterium]